MTDEPSVLRYWTCPLQHCLSSGLAQDMESGDAKRRVHLFEAQRRVKEEDPIIPFSDGPIISKWGAISRSSRTGYHTTDPIQATASQGSATKPISVSGTGQAGGCQVGGEDVAQACGLSLCLFACCRLHPLCQHRGYKMEFLQLRVPVLSTFHGAVSETFPAKGAPSRSVLAFLPFISNLVALSRLCMHDFLHICMQRCHKGRS